jgi:hypothetical protein
MTAHILQNSKDQIVDITYEAPRQLDWVVQKDPKLEAELNELKGKKISPKVVNKILDRIREL